MYHSLPQNQDLLTAAEHATQLQDELDVTKQYASKAVSTVISVCNCPYSVTWQKKYDSLMESYQKKKGENKECFVYIHCMYAYVIMNLTGIL